MPRATIASAVEALVRSRPGICRAQVVAALALEEIGARTAENVLAHLRRTHRIRQDEQHGLHPLASEPTAPRRVVLHVLPGVPMLALGPGSRRDCALYEQCLTRFLALHPIGDAHCPKACASFAPYPSRRDLERLGDRRAHPQVTL